VSSESGSPSSTPTSSPAKAAKKPDLVSIPAMAVLAACVIAAMGNSRGDPVLTWMVPLGLVGAALAFVAWKSWQARRQAS
jgi:hypothetical protein